MKNNKIIIITLLVFLLTIGLFFGITYAYFDLNIKSEDSSTMIIGGAQLSAKFESTSTITIENALPGDTPIGYKDFSITVKNTSNNSYKLYLKTIIDLNTFTDTENDGVLYYDIYSGTNYSTVVQEKTMFPTIAAGKAILKELTISPKTNTTTKYRLNLYFPKSDKIQNKNGQLVLNAKITIENTNDTSSLTPLFLHLNNTYNKAATDNGLEKDDTPEKNIRYVGASPRNYLKFNGDEIWRIIGVFNNITTIDENGKEKKESLVKIVRNDLLGNYSWDTSESSINNGWGVNEWSQADLMYELNCDGSGSTAYCRSDIAEGYLSNKTSGTTLWYNGQNNEKNGSYDYRKNIKSSSLDKVAKVRWNLGGYNTYSVSALNMYNAERGTLHISNPSDGIARKNAWDGKIALIYPSDYGYASTGAACKNSLYDCDDADSKVNNWLFNSAYQWTLSPSSGDADYVFRVGSGGDVSDRVAFSTYGVRPALFLKSDVVIAGGTGESIENAYTLE